VLSFSWRENWFSRVNCFPKLGIYSPGYDSGLYVCSLIIELPKTQLSESVVFLCSGWINIINEEISWQFFLWQMTQFFPYDSCEWRLVQYCGLHSCIWVIMLLAEQLLCATSLASEVCDSVLEMVLWEIQFTKIHVVILSLWSIWNMTAVFKCIQ